MSENINNPDETSSCMVLYVEDNPANTRLMQDIFSEFLSPCELICASNAEDGIQLSLEHNPELVLMDINMSGMNGYQALEVMKSNPESAGIPVIAISADALPEQIEDGLAKGFADYISKPFNVSKLIETINQHLTK